MKLVTSNAIYGVDAGVPSSKSIKPIKLTIYIPSCNYLTIPIIIWSKYGLYALPFGTSNP